MSDICIVIRYNLTVKKSEVLATLKRELRLRAIAAEIFELPMGAPEPCIKAMSHLIEEASSLETDGMFSKTFNADCSYETIASLTNVLHALDECMLHYDPKIESIYGCARVALLHAFLWCIVREDSTEHFIRSIRKWMRKIQGKRNKRKESKP